MGGGQQSKLATAAIAVSNAEDQPLTINHPKFNNIKVISPPSEDDEGIIETTISLPSENQFKKWDKTVKGLEQSDNIFLPLNQKFEKTEFCGSGGFATVQYRYYPYLLSDEVVNRCNIEGKYFQEVELWYLIYSIIQAGSSFHSKGEKVGDIQPKNVFISPEGQVRVATQHTWPGQSTNYLKTIFEKQITYLSPEQLKDIGYGKLDESSNFAINESFSVGLTCLDAATLTNCSKLYQPNNKFNYNSLEDKLISLEQSGNYSQPLVLVIKSLCQVDTERRASCRELAQWLGKYQQAIIELQEFNVQQLPEKLQNLRNKSVVDSRMKRSEPHSQPITYGGPPPQQHVTYVNAPPGTGSRPDSVIRQPVPQYVAKPMTYAPPPGQYVNQSGHVPMVQSYYGVQQGPSPHMQQNNPSVMTFQKDPKSMIVEQGNTVNSQVRGNINLQQIDEQLQKSRNLFPS